jgi:hypothetical protein
LNGLFKGDKDEEIKPTHYCEIEIPTEEEKKKEPKTE